MQHISFVILHALLLTVLFLQACKEACVWQDQRGTWGEQVCGERGRFPAAPSG